MAALWVTSVLTAEQQIPVVEYKCCWSTSFRNAVDSSFWQEVTLHLKEGALPWNWGCRSEPLWPRLTRWPGARAARIIFSVVFLTDFK